MTRRLRQALVAGAITAAVAGGATAVAHAQTSDPTPTTTPPAASSNPASGYQGSENCPNMGGASASSSAASNA
jgi:hypothetical protein